MIRDGEKLLLSFDIGSVPWKYVESDDSIEDEMTEAQGIMRADRQVVYVNRSETPPEGYEYVFFHEAGHAVFFTTGVKEALKQITGFEGDKCTQLEEFLMSNLMHAMYDTLKRNGWLKIPL